MHPNLSPYFYLDAFAVRKHGCMPFGGFFDMLCKSLMKFGKPFTTLS